MKQRKKYVLDKAELRKAVAATTTIPDIFIKVGKLKPVRKGDQIIFEEVEAPQEKRLAEIPGILKRLVDLKVQCSLIRWSRTGIPKQFLKEV